MSRELATIKLDVPIDFELEKCRWGDYDREKLLEIFRRFEFFSLIPRLEESERHIESADKTEGLAFAESYGAAKEKVLCTVIKTEKDLDALIGKIEKSQTFILKTLETEHKIAEQNITGMIFAFDKKEIFFMPIACETAAAPTLFDEKKSRNDFLERLKPYL